MKQLEALGNTKVVVLQGAVPTCNTLHICGNIFYDMRTHSDILHVMAVDVGGESKMLRSVMAVNVWEHILIYENIF